MEFLQVYDRKNNTWTELLKLEVGYQENWVIDKTTDSAEKITVKFRNYKLNTGKESVDWDIMDWVRLRHAQGVMRERPAPGVTFNGQPVMEWYEDYSGDVPEYDAEGLPTNSTQYVIAAVKQEYRQVTDTLSVYMSLAEPITRAVGIVGETLSYTNQTEKTVDEGGVSVTYVKDPYNHYTALERWLKVTPANCDDYEHDTREQRAAWFNRIKILDEAWLRSLPFNDDTYNELTLYNVLMDKFDASVGRTPVLYFDIDPATDLPRNPARDEYVLKFERQDGYDKPVLYWAREDVPEGVEVADEDLLSYNVIDPITTNKDASNYATGLVANITNLSAGTPVAFPSEGFYAVPEVDADVRDLTGYSKAGDSWGIRFPNKIKKILKVEHILLTMISSANPPYAPTNIKAYRENITTNCFEKKEYSTKENVSNLLWYEEGGNFLHIRNYFYLNGDVGMIYYIEYEPLIDARISFGNMEFAQQINQNSSQVDAGQFGAYAQQYLNSMNKADFGFGRHYQTDDYFKYSQHIGSRVKKGDKEYFVTAMGTQNRQFQTDVFYQLNEEHFRKNLSYQASQEVRVNTAIGTDNLKDRQTEFKQSIKISLNPFQGNRTIDKMTFYDILLFSALIPDGNYLKNYYPEIAKTTIRSNLRKQDGTTINKKKSLFTPLIRYQAKNHMHFNIQYLDNALAGKSKTTKSNVFLGYPDGQIPILYTDPFGEIENTIIEFIRTDHIDILNESILPYDFFVVYRAMCKLPEIYNIPQQSIQTVIKTKSINIFKDSMEIENISITFEVNSKDIIICDGLLKFSRLMNSGDIGGVPILAFLDTKISENDIVDLNALSAQGQTRNITAWSGEEPEKITFTLSSPYTDEYKSIIIFRNNKKCLIFNQLNDTITNDIKNGQFSMYFRRG